MPQRRDDQVLDNEGLILKFAGKTFPYKERTIKQTKEWIRKVAEQDGSVNQKFFSTDKPEERISIIATLGYDQVAGLVSDYTDGAVTIEQIEEGTPRELEAAFSDLLLLAGFFDLAWGKTRRLARTV